MKDYNQDEESSYLSQKLSVDSFKWRNDKSNFDEKLMKCYNVMIIKYRYMKSVIIIQGIYMIYKVIYHFFRNK